MNLIDVADNAAVGGAGPFPNSGVLFWTIPTSLGYGPTCGRSFRFYVENYPRTHWIYGPVFTAICPTGSQTFNIANGDVAGLIAAVNTANTTPDPDVINLAPGGNYTLTAAAQPDGFTGDTGLPFIVRPLTINGFGATIQRSSAAGTPEFRVAYAIHSDLTLNGVTIAGGRGGASQRGGGGLGVIGGTLIVRNSTVTQNYSVAMGGGGIANICGLLIVENSTISHNTGAGGWTGGGIMNHSDSGGACTGRVLISNTTIFENRAIDGRGDALADAHSPAGHVVVKNSILASPTQGVGGDCIGNPPDSKGYNIASDTSCMLSATGDSNGVNPNLAPLAYNGGPTPTNLPVTGSPVIDAIPVAACTNVFGSPVTTDQRGILRPQGPACDKGSVDIQGDTTAPLIAPSVSGIPGNAGWYRGPVTVNWTVIDAESGVSSSSGCGTTVLPSDTPGTTLICSAMNGAGLTGSASVTVKIDQTSPVVGNVMANPNPAPVNTPVMLSANLSDSGGSNLTLSRYTVNGSAPATLAAAGGTSASVNGTVPAFATPGVYNVCVDALDLAGNTGLAECVLLAVYDPIGGFVTGGGWINSPAGAYSANPSLTGKATFGFESKYQPGANVPTGNTQFQFKVADLNFKSTSYDWLVVAGARAQFKGLGTINGAGSYGFLLTAIDGDSPGGNIDRFRIKITGPGGVVYDNQAGGGDNDDPTTALGGGSIVIHKGNNQ